jgi:hypothetical protein
MKNISNRIKKLEDVHQQIEPMLMFINFVDKNDRDTEPLYYKCNGIVFKNDATIEDRIIKQCDNSSYGIDIAFSCNKDGT